MNILNKLTPISKDNIVFFLIFIIYSLFLSPTPRDVSIYIFFVAILFIYFFLNEIKFFFINLKKKKKIEILICIFLVYNLTITFLNFDFINYKGLFRDYISLGYLLLPYLFINKLKKYNENQFEIIIFTLLFCGVLILVRLTLKNYYINNIFSYRIHDLLYLKNDCLILFSINYLCLYSYYKKQYNLLFFFLLIFFYLHYFLWESSLGIIKLNFYYAIIILSLNCNVFLRNILQKLNLIFVSKSFKYLWIIFFLIFFLTLKDSSTLKFLNFNNRYNEFIFFNEVINSSFKTILTGIGYGNGFIIDYLSPNEKIYFLHIFILYIIIKIGLIGFLILANIYLIVFKDLNIDLKNFYKLFNLKQRKNLLAVSFLPTFFTGITYVTTYKTFTFWVILSIIICNHIILNNNNKNKNV